MQERLERYTFDDAIVRKFFWATVLWGIVGMLVGLTVATQLAAPEMNLGKSWFSFGRLRPLHTNAIIFAFAGNAIFTGVYYSTQRLLKARMFSSALSQFHFWGWQLIIVAAAITLPLGITQSKEYAELEWPIDIMIALVWVAFGVNLFGTIAKRRERHIYVAIWFYIATVIAIAVLHIFNNLAVPAGLTKSYSIYAGVQDAFMQWWYGHDAVAFFLTTPFLGLMYYFMPKAADRPVFSYRLSIIHFWTLVFIYIWAGPHHLHYTALPQWASTLGMLFSVILWMPSWGGMINGLLTLRGAWHKVAEDPILKFFVVAVTFYGMSTFEGPVLALKSVNKLSHYTDWTIAHVHAGGLGWVGFMTFGMLYWLAPRLFQAPLRSRKLAEVHFWIGTLGILLYIVPIYVAGITQGLMWFAFDDDGALKYGDFVQTTTKLMPFYWARILGGALYLTGALLMAWNLLATWRKRPKKYEIPEYEAPALSANYEDAPLPPPPLEVGDAPVLKSAFKIQRFAMLTWHRRWERLPLFFSIMVAVAVVSASLFEILPTFLLKSNVPTIATVTPYTPLELRGRDIYIENGCYNCHSQMIRPIWAETTRYGEYSKPGEFIYNHPFQWGSRRIGPDLAREGVSNPSGLWHVNHFIDPPSVKAGSIMPSYAWLATDEGLIDWAQIERSMRAMRTLGVPYSEDDITNAVKHAEAQAKAISAAILLEADPNGLLDADERKFYLDLQNKELMSLIAYIQRLGTDLGKPLPEPSSEEAAK